MRIPRWLAAALVLFPASLLAGCRCPYACGGPPREMYGHGEGMRGPPAGMHQGPPMAMQQGPPPGMQGPPPGMQQGPPPGMQGPPAGSQDLARVMERIERIEMALREGRGPGREGGPGDGPQEPVRREMQEMRAGMEKREGRIRELEQQVEKLEGVLRRMKEERRDAPPARPEEKR